MLVGGLGTWMQFTTLTFFVAQLAGTPARAALNVGLLGAARAVAVLSASPFAGVVADRYPRRRILMLTNASASCLSLTLAVLTVLHAITIPMILVLAACLGATQAFDSPARQSWIPFLVPREDVANAIGLGQFAFNAPSVLGPPIAGFLIVTTGIATSFFVNAATVLAVLSAVVLMQPLAAQGKVHESIFGSMAGGIGFLARHAVLRWVILTLLINATLLRPYTFLLSAYALHVVHTDARGLGFLLASGGTGAMCGTVLTAAVPTRQRARRWCLAAATMAAGMLGLGLTHSFAVAVGALFLLGLGNLSFTGASNILIQTLAPSDIRGRAISVYSMILLGMVPAGTLILGSIAAATNLSATLTGAGVVALVALAWTWVAHPALRSA